MTSAPGCWAKHGELSAHHLSDPDAGDYRQLCADAYAVQHPGQPGPQATQSVGGHLVNLFAQLEVGLPVARAATIIERGIRQKRYFTWLTPPSFEGAHTIVFMLANLYDRRWAAREWAASAWKAWAPHHAQVRGWYQDLSRASTPNAAV